MMRYRYVCALTLFGFAAHCGAAENDPWQIKIGFHDVSPKSNNGTLAGGTLKADVGDDAKPTLALEYFLTSNWGVEILAALPFEHEVKLNGAKAADVKQLPPTLSVQYHFVPEAKVSPFVGVGLNFTRFFSIHETGPLAGTQLNLSDSWGGALHFGLDWRVAPRWTFTVDGRWMNIETTARVNGANVGKVKIDPFVWGASIGYRF